MSHSVLLELGNTCVVPQSADIDPFEDIQVGVSHGSPSPCPPPDCRGQEAAAGHHGGPRHGPDHALAQPRPAARHHRAQHPASSLGSRPGSVFRHKSCPSFSVFTDNSHFPSILHSVVCHLLETVNYFRSVIYC